MGMAAWLARGFTIIVRPPTAAVPRYQVTYRPRSLSAWGTAFLDAQGKGNGPTMVEAFVGWPDEAVELRWATPLAFVPPSEVEQDALARVRLLHLWLGRLTGLVATIEA